MSLALAITDNPTIDLSSDELILLAPSGHLAESLALAAQKVSAYFPGIRVVVGIHGVTKRENLVVLPLVSVIIILYVVASDRSTLNIP